MVGTEVEQMQRHDRFPPHCRNFAALACCLLHSAEPRHQIVSPDITGKAAL